MTHDPAKQAAGWAAADLVTDGMALGYGTGSTVAFFLERLAARDLDVYGVATSEATADRCRALDLDVRTVDEVARVDLVIDGADELTTDLVLTKGGGGALLREKVVAQLADQMVVIATPDKLVDRLGATFALPIEVVPFAVAPVRRRLEQWGCEVALRDGITDNENRILDAHLRDGIDDPVAYAHALADVAGIAEHGLFIDLATAALLGQPDGSVTWIGHL